MLLDQPLTHINTLRVHEKTTLHFQGSRHPGGKAREGRIAGYLTDEQHSQTGGIGASKCEVIFERALNTSKRLFSSALSIHVTVCLLFFSLLFLFTGCSVHKPSTAADRHDASPASQIIHFYQGPLNHLSAVRYGGCPMHPGCSEYGLSAIEKHGPLIGWMMTFDRLMRCGLDETSLSPEVMVDGNWKYIDTLEQNDFWWYHDNKNTALINTQPLEQSLDWGISIE